MSSLLTNSSFLSLKRQLAVGNRNSNSPTTPSKRANRLPALPELSGEQDEYFSLPSATSSTSSTSSNPSPPACPEVKRLRRYGMDEFGTFGLTDDFFSTIPRTAPQPPPSSSSPSSSSSSPSAKPVRQSVRLSAFDIVIDISASEPASPVSEIPLAPCTPPRLRDPRRLSPPRSHSPTPSLTSMSACSSMEMPTTPGTSDDESPGLRLHSNKKAVARPRLSKHPLMIKSTSSPSPSDANPEDAFEFTFGPFSPHPGLEAEEMEAAEMEEDDDALWYSRELSQVVTLSSPQTPSNSRPRPDSLLPMPRSASSGTDQPACSRTGKLLPDIPNTSVPNPQLDPTFPQTMTLHASTDPSEPPSPLTLPSPVAPVTSHKSSESTSHRKSLTITVPRTLLSNDISVSEILDDINAWSLDTPTASTSSGTSTGTLVLSPPRVPHSPSPSQCSEYDPVEFVVSYAARPSSPTPASSLPTTACTEMPATFLDLEDEETGTYGADDKMRSRWSCSTLASPTSPTASARLRLHLASVARRVRIRRVGWSSNSSNGSDERTASIHREESMQVRAPAYPYLWGSIMA